MNEVTVAGFRCFNEEQTARLAPLTILVGENSTGKTSLLALLRALWDTAFRERVPDFKEPPYDLGSFDDIAHDRGGSPDRATEFAAGFRLAEPGSSVSGSEHSTASRFHVRFRREGSAPLPSTRRVESADAWAEATVSRNGEIEMSFGTPNGHWKFDGTDLFARGWNKSARRSVMEQPQLTPIGYLIHTSLLRAEAELPGPKDAEAIRRLDKGWPPSFSRLAQRPFASAPVRSRPRRTYDPARTMEDAESEYVPMLLADLAIRDHDGWTTLKSSLERFGHDAGLFDEIEVKLLGDRSGDPFQVHVRKFGHDGKAPTRNVIDVGYGVSQVLPVATELLRPTGPRMFLLQHPEVHLHPSAQAALGGLFCGVAAKGGGQIIVETHSDHLIDRIRMDIRDGRTDLSDDDVSILYFQRRNQAVTIHSHGWDANGNLVARRGAIPDGYREFFRTERRRSIGLGRDVSRS